MELKATDQRSDEAEGEDALELEAPRPVPEVKARVCLMCGVTFHSEGAHNRICPKCKSSQAWRSG